MGAVRRPEHLLVVADQLRTGGRNLMADRLPPAAQEEVDKIDAVPIRGILLWDSKANAEAGHCCEEYFIVRLAGLRVYMCSHGIAAEDNLVTMRAKTFFETLAHLRKAARP